LENTHNFIMPPTNLIGVGAIKDLPKELMSHKLKKALIVTDKNIMKFGYIEMVETILKSLFISYDIFDRILHPNATVTFVEDGLAHFDKGLNLLKRDYSFIISVGGGTNHDTAKAIAVVATNGGSICDYEGYNKMTKLSLPVITINTTAGSASELTSVAIITDESRKVKMTIADPKMMPILSINEPMFMTTMPKEVTACSGIDVVSHAIEAFVSSEASPITDALALGALKLAFGHLQRSYENGNDIQAREQMMFANCMAGMAFNNAGLGYVHSLAHQVGGFYNTIHGAVNAILLPHVLDYNAESIPDERIFKICDAVGDKAKNKVEAVDKIMNSIQRLSRTIGIPNRLKDLGVDEKDLQMLSVNAAKDITALTNPRQGTASDIMGIFKAAM
jgi:alcohol dehydrogenase